MVVMNESIAACAYNKDDNTKINNNGCGGKRGKDFVWQRGSYMRKVSQLPAGPRIGAACFYKILPDCEKLMILT